MYSENEIQEFWEMYKSGMSCSDIADKIGESKSYVVRNIYSRFPDEKLEIGRRNKNSKISESLTGHPLSPAQKRLIVNSNCTRCGNLMVGVSTKRKYCDKCKGFLNREKFYSNLVFEEDYVSCPYCGWKGSKIDKNHFKEHSKTKEQVHKEFPEFISASFKFMRSKLKYAQNVYSEIDGHTFCNETEDRIYKVLSRLVGKENIQTEYHQIKYFSKDKNRLSVYFPDFYVEKYNWIIEATYSLSREKDVKLESAEKQGYEITCIFNKESIEAIDQILELKYFELKSKEK